MSRRKATVVAVAAVAAATAWTLAGLWWWALAGMVRDVGNATLATGVLLWFVALAASAYADSRDKADES